MFSCIFWCRSHQGVGISCSTCLSAFTPKYLEGTSCEWLMRWGLDGIFSHVSKHGLCLILHDPDTTSWVSWDTRAHSCCESFRACSVTSTLSMFTLVFHIIVLASPYNSCRSMASLSSCQSLLVRSSVWGVWWRTQSLMTNLALLWSVDIYLRLPLEAPLLTVSTQHCSMCKCKPMSLTPRQEKKTSRILFILRGLTKSQSHCDVWYCRKVILVCRLVSLAHTRTL